MESHQNGGDHYHYNVKLLGSKRWKAVKDTLKKESSIQVHFSGGYDNYKRAFKCITKSDANIFLSSNHPHMQEMGFPKTKVCVQSLRQKRKSRFKDTSGGQVSTTTNPPKKERLSNLEVSEFITRNKISNEDKVFAIAHTQSDLHIHKSGLFAFTKWLEVASEKIQGANMSRMDLIEKAYQKDDCV